MNSGPFFILLAALLWSTDALFRQPLLNSVPGTVIVLLEHLFGLGILVPLLLPRIRELRKLNAVDWLAVSVIGIGGSAVATVLFTNAFQYVGPSVAILLQKIQPLVVLTLAAGMLNERLRGRFWLWSGVAIAAAYVISFPELTVNWSLYDEGTRGILFALGAAFLWGASTVLGRRVVQKVSFQTISALRFMVAVITLAVIAVVQGSFASVTAIDENAFLRLLAIVFVSGTIPILFYYRGLRNTRASVSTIIELAFPFSAVILNWIFLDDRLVWQQLVAGVVLLISIVRVQQLNNSKPADVPPNFITAPTVN